MSAEHAASMDLLTWILHSNVVNVALVLALFAWLFNKFDVPAKWDAHHRATVAGIEAYQAAREQARQQRDGARRRESQVAKEVESLLAEAKQSAEAVSTQLLEQARAEADRILANAQARLALEERAALRALEQKLLADVVAAARERLAREMSEDDRRRSVEAVIEALPRLKEGAAL